MTARPLRIRSIVRHAAAAAVILFCWHALSRVAAGAAEGPPLAGISALLLIALLVAVSRLRERA